MSDVYVRRLSRWQAEQLREAVADLYITAYRGAAGAEYRDRRAFLDRFEKDVRRADFDMTVADANGLVGCAYGFRADRTGAWWADFRGGLPFGVEERTASGHVFVLAEVMVLPSFRRRGVATRLWDLLLMRLGTDLVVAATDRPEHAAEPPGTALLRAWDWEHLGMLDPGAEPGALAREVWTHDPVR